MYKIKEKGFTLIELLVVIAIIGILAGTLFVAINPKAQANKAKDANRASQFRELEKALDRYYLDHGYYPKMLTHNYHNGENKDNFKNEIKKYINFDLNSKLWDVCRDDGTPCEAEFLYKSSDGDNYQSYGMALIFSDIGNKYQKNDGGPHTWWELGKRPKYCMSKYSGSDAEWWHRESTVCKGGN